MAMQSGVMNTRNMEFQRISVLTLNFTVAKAKPAANTATPELAWAISQKKDKPRPEA